MTFATLPLRRLVLDACDGPFGSALKSDHYADSGARVVRLGNIGTGSWIDGDSAYLPMAYWATLSRHHAVAGDLLVAGLGDEKHPVGRACVLPDVGPAMVKADCYRLRLDQDKADARFVARYLSCAAGEAEALRLADGATRSRLTLGKAMSIPVPDLPLRDQRAIADYLDTETAKIDRIVGLKRSQARTLEERMQSAVDACLGGARRRHGSPTVPLKRLVDPARPITYGIVQAGPNKEGGIPYIRPIDMSAHDGVPDPSLLQRTSREIAATYGRSTIRAGDVVVSIGPSFGKTMIVPAELDGANLTQGTARVAPRSGIRPDFLVWVLRHSRTVAYWNAAVGGATFRALNLEPLSRTPVLSLPETAQIDVCLKLNGERDQVRELASVLDRQVSLLLERRQALITAAVTGEFAIPGVAA